MRQVHEEGCTKGYEEAAPEIKWKMLNYLALFIAVIECLLQTAW